MFEINRRAQAVKPAWVEQTEKRAPSIEEDTKEQKVQDAKIGKKK